MRKDAVVTGGPASVRITKALLRAGGLKPGRAAERAAAVSLRLAHRQQGLEDLLPRLRDIVPDISAQETSGEASFNAYAELKRRGLQAFQCRLMLEALEGARKDRLTVVDVGDSAGTHTLYLRALTQGRFQLETVSVNLDPRAIAKIRARGLNAVLCRAEELALEQPVDLFTSFEMLEHLHNPAIFLRRLAKRKEDSRLLITVPYLRRSRVGLHHIRSQTQGPVHAEDAHIFELSPPDWTLLMRHAGWRVAWHRVYRQYPRGWPPGLSPLLAWFWRKTDFEGFWGALLERDTSLSDAYQDWEA